MLFIYLQAIAVAASPAGLLATRADNAAAILKSLAQLYQDTKAQNTTFNGISVTGKPTASQVLTVASGFNTLDKDFNNTFALYQSSAVLTASEADSVAAYLKSPIQPAAAQLADNIARHCACVDVSYDKAYKPSDSHIVHSAAPGTTSAPPSSTWSRNFRSSLVVPSPCPGAARRRLRRSRPARARAKSRLTMPLPSAVAVEEEPRLDFSRTALCHAWLRA